MSTTKTATKLTKEKKNVENWIRRYGITNTMRRTARHLLPGKKFTFHLNLGGGSYTDGKKVVVGVPEFSMGMDKPTIYSLIKALTGHETEHVWSSDFKVFKDFQMEVKEFFLKEYNLKVTPSLGAHMLNSTEDGRIEKRLINRYRGYQKHIQLLNGLMWKEGGARGQNEMMDFVFCITSICVTGMKSKEWEKHYEGTEQDLLLDEIRPLIIKAINNPTAQGCADDTMDIIKAIAPYMARLLQDIKNMQELAKLMDKPDFESSEPQEGADSQPGSSYSTHFLEEESPNPQPSAEKGEGEGESGESEEESDEQSDEEGSEDDESNEGNESSDEDEMKDEEELDGELDKSDELEIEETPSENSENKESELENESTESESESETDEEDELPGTEEVKPTPEEIDELIDRMLEELTDEVVEEAEKAMEQGEKEVQKEQARELKENTYDGHLSEDEMKGFDKSVNFRNIDPKRTRSQALPEEVLKAGKFLNKEFKKIFKSKQTFSSRNRRAGHLDTSNLWKPSVKDYNTFVKKGMPNDTSTVVNVLVDSSGSMESYANGWSGPTKLEKATEATAMIEEGLRGLVPVRISYFTSLYNTVIHSTVKDFNQDSKETLSWTRLPNFENMANRDGYSIKVATHELLKRREQKKILIVLSDGLPTDPTTRSGQKEVREAVREARKAGVIVIAIAFGSEQEIEKNKPVYKEMYQKGILMVRPDEIHKYLAKAIKTELDR